MSFAIRQAQLGDVEVALDWAKAEGWNPGTADASRFYAADPGGFFVGELDGRMVSTISAVTYGAGFGFVGLYIVHPDFRGRGFGLATWRHALERVARGNTGLDGVLAKEAVYAESGFTTAHRNVRYRANVVARGAVGGASPPAIPPEAWRSLMEFDRRFFPAERPAFIKAWVGQPGVESCFEERDGEVRGYGVMRPCHEGWKIGPLFARDAAVAGRLFAGLLDRAGAGPVFIDVPENNAAAVALVRGAGLEPVFATVRMYTRGQPADVDWAGVFGITTFELG